METRDLFLRDEVYSVVGCALEVLSTLGHGLHEKPYENALAVEFRLKKVPFIQQHRFPVIYKAVEVAEYVPDLIAYGQMVVDVKVIDRITDHERGQMINYLRTSACLLGLVLNFKRARLEWERIILSRPVPIPDPRSLAPAQPIKHSNPC